MDSTFVRHNPCPKCGSRDNLGVYSDGHEWCFGCGYYKPAERTLENSRPRTELEAGYAPNLLTVDSPDRFPLRALQWLRKYGISDEEIQKYEIVWVPDKDSLVLGNQYRYFGPNPAHPKAISFKKGRILIEGNVNREVCVLVEDFISAIKVGRWVGALPLFGSGVSATDLIWATTRFSRVGVWLDPDMKKKASKAVLTGGILAPAGVQVVGVYTDKDPKDYETNEIKDILESQISRELFQVSVV